MVPSGRNSGHLPVMVEEVVGHLVQDRSGAYLDLTVGLGGHLAALAELVDRKARLYGVDRDQDALNIAKERCRSASQHIEFVHSSYADLQNLVGGWSDTSFDGILLDLGLSSQQIDTAARGFSFAGDGPLDMRFDQREGLPTAADLINGLEKSQLAEIFREYGEERNAAKLAAAIVTERQKEMILTTSHLKRILDSNTHSLHRTKTAARVFQALRIAVNEELQALISVLPITVDLLKQGGRLAVLSYHSLEDRIVKRFFQQEAKGCVCPEDIPVCVCGKTPTVKIITKHPLQPSEKEIADNSRARSAKLRVAERI